MSVETLAGIAMIAAAAWLFVLAARRARHERSLREWQALIASAHQARTASGRTRARHLRTR